jgi:hypothetical protein
MIERIFSPGVVRERKSTHMGNRGSKSKPELDLSFLNLDKEQDENVTVYTETGQQPQQHIFQPNGLQGHECESIRNLTDAVYGYAQRRCEWPRTAADAIEGMLRVMPPGDQLCTSSTARSRSVNRVQTFF